MDEKGLVMKNLCTLFSSLMGSMLMCVSLCSFADAPSIKMSEQGISYMTGDISEEEVEVMRQHTQQFNLRIIFSEGKSGRSITDVNVSIYDKGNTLIFDVMGLQPQLLVNLPTGTYKIVANYNGVKQSHSLSITTDKPKKIILNWKNNTEEDQLNEADIDASD
jgi:hypothetical protein